MKKIDVDKMTAIRCAKAAVLISSLRNSLSSSNNNSSQLQIDEDDIEMERLKLKVMMKRLANERRDLRRLIGVGTRMFLLGFTILVLLIIAFNSL